MSVMQKVTYLGADEQKAPTLDTASWTSTEERRVAAQYRYVPEEEPEPTFLTHLEDSWDSLVQGDPIDALESFIEARRELTSHLYLDADVCFVACTSVAFQDIDPERLSCLLVGRA